MLATMCNLANDMDNIKDKMKYKIQIPAILLLTLCHFQLMNAQNPGKVLWENNAFQFYPDKIIQDKYTARAVSSTEMESNYTSPANSFKSPEIIFKFSINGKDNEMISGRDHHFIYPGQDKNPSTPVIRFGEQYVDAGKVPDNFYLPANAPLKIRLDMRAVLSDFNTRGFYECFNGTKIYKQDFNGVYMAGNTYPLHWDFDNLVNNPAARMTDEDGDGIYEATLILNVHTEKARTAQNWKLTKDISAFPQYRSDYPLMDAVYNMSLEEMQNAIEPDSTFRTGKEWAGVWTRDISYSIILSMAYLQPEVARKSLLRKVSPKKRIIQDTGTGGAWPVSTDRMIWAVAAFELYKATLDKAWLAEAYQIVKNSIDDDLMNVYDDSTGLVKGESSFLDWREQTYPKWMQPADIFGSENLGTNAVHYQANRVLSEMAKLVNDTKSAAKYAKIAGRIKAGINKYLWMPEKGYYAQYIYGGNYKMVSPRSEALGEALAVIFGIAGKENAAKIVSNTPVTPYGISCIYPQIPNIPPYHNNGVWPFVQSFWLWAGVKAGNETSVMQSIAALYRTPALFLTNKENFVAEDGDFLGTQINSSNMLWSLSGNISIIHKVLFGIRYEPQGLTFSPFVPQSLSGTRTLTNFKYRGALFQITLSGYGNTIKRFILDGKVLPKAAIPASLKGTHEIKIELSGNMPLASKTNNVPNAFSPATPLVSLSGDQLSWDKAENADSYTVLRNGKKVKSISGNTFPVSSDAYAEYQIIAVAKSGLSSFASEPIAVFPPNSRSITEMETVSKKSDKPFKGYTGEGFVEISATLNTVLKMDVDIVQTGYYLVDFRYANGNGPTNTENKCAIRNFLVDNKKAGTFVYPQRGKEEWSNWGYSNSIKVWLTKGKHQFILKYEPFNENMNGAINQAMLDYMRVIKM